LSIDPSWGTKGSLTFRLQDDRGGQQVGQLLEGISAAALLPAGRHELALGSQDGTVSFWRLPTGSALPERVKQAGYIVPLQAGKNSLFLALLSPAEPVKESKTLDVDFRLAPLSGGRPGKILGRAQLAPPHFAFELSPDGSRLVVADAHGVTAWDVKDGRRAAGPFPHREVDSLAFSHGGRILASAGGHTIQLWDLEKGAPRPVRSLTSKAIFR